MREAARVIVVDEDERVLLVRFDLVRGGHVWATVGGGLERGETHEDAARRELREEAGLEGVELGPCIWTREHVFDDMVDFAGQRERYYVVRTPVFEPSPGHTWEQLNAERVSAIRWWTIDEILGAPESLFAPRRLGTLLRELLDRGSPTEPIDVGV
jgi:ADP-ribose pyrophosphatase YjhB (NUDIX family)